MISQVDFVLIVDQLSRNSTEAVSLFELACVAGVRKGREGGDKERMEGEGTGVSLAFSPPTPSPFTPARQAMFESSIHQTMMTFPNFLFLRRNVQN